MQVQAANPRFEGYDPSKEEAPKKGGLGKVAKVLLAVGVVAVVGAAGFFGGSAYAKSDEQVAAPADTPSTDSGSADPTTSARSTLLAALNDPENLAVTGSLTATQIENAIKAYNANPAAWNDQYLTKDIVLALKVYYDAFQAEMDDTRSLLATPNVRGENDRTLDAILGDQYDLALFGWREIQTTTYPNAVISDDGEDQATVYSKGGYCVAIAEETSTDADWDNNKKTGIIDILSLKPTIISDENECGCAQQSTVGSWCAVPAQCERHAPIGEGFRGFTEAYNQMRLGLYERMKDCVSTTGQPILITGYSRGGAIMSIFAYSILEQNLFPGTEVSLITYGAPRVLEDASSDKLHNKPITNLRLVYKKDPVPSLPYGWMGVKHAGTMICNACGYRQNRDSPGFGWPNDSHFHTKYSEWFPLE